MNDYPKFITVLEKLIKDNLDKINGLRGIHTGVLFKIDIPVLSPFLFSDRVRETDRLLTTYNLSEVKFNINNNIDNTGIDHTLIKRGKEQFFLSKISGFILWDKDASIYRSVKKSNVLPSHAWYDEDKRIWEKFPWRSGECQSSYILNYGWDMKKILCIDEIVGQT